MRTRPPLLEEEYTFGIYVLVLARGVTRLLRTPVYLLDNVPRNHGGWGFYLPHGISIGEHGPSLFATLQKTRPADWKDLPALESFIRDQLELLFPGVRKQFSYVGAPYSRFQRSRSRREDRLYWMIPVSVSFFDQGRSDYRSRRFMNTWRWFSLREIRGNAELCASAGYILHPIVDVATGEEVRPIVRQVLGVRDSFGDLLGVFNQRWAAVLTVLVALFTLVSLVTGVISEVERGRTAAERREQQARLWSLATTRTDPNAWADRYLADTPVSSAAEWAHKEGCLLSKAGAALTPERRKRLEARLATLSTVYGPFACR